MSLTGHRVTETWLGQRIETLADLLPVEPIAVFVGINPAPLSVATGHYYQGRLGQRLWSRLRSCGLLRDTEDFEDDAAVERGFGFTDVVKRPTARASEISRAELHYGAAQLRDKLATARTPVVVFTFKKAAEALVVPFAGYGWTSDTQVGNADVFVMPGPYEKIERVSLALASLAERLDIHRQE